MKKLSILVVAVLVASVRVSVFGQAAVGPTAPQPSTIAVHEQNLRSLLTATNADKVWSTGDAKAVNQLLTDLQDAQIDIQGIVGPVAPKPKPKPRPVTPSPKPKKEEIEDAVAALRGTLEEASKKQPSLQLPADSDAQLRRITITLKGAQ